MGTRADFYVGRDRNAEWLGSVAWDGYPEGYETKFYRATTEQEYRDLVTEVAEEREDWIAPENGWPWPWDDSRTTDYAYAFEDGKVYGAGFGRGWFELADDGSGEPENDEYWDQPKLDTFPNMKERAMSFEEQLAVSGLIIINQDGVVQ